MNFFVIKQNYEFFILFLNNIFKDPKSHKTANPFYFKTFNFSFAIFQEGNLNFNSKIF